MRGAKMTLRMKGPTFTTIQTSSAVYSVLAGRDIRRPKQCEYGALRWDRKMKSHLRKQKDLRAGLSTSRDVMCWRPWWVIRAVSSRPLVKFGTSREWYCLDCLMGALERKSPYLSCMKIIGQSHHSWLTKRDPSCTYFPWIGAAGVWCAPEKYHVRITTRIGRITPHEKRVCENSLGDAFKVLKWWV